MRKLKTGKVLTNGIPDDFEQIKDKSRVFFDKIITTVTSKPDEPDFEVKNPSNRDLSFDLSLILNSRAKQDMNLLILNGRDTMLNVITEPLNFKFFDTDELHYTFIRLKANDSLKIFVWARTGLQVNLTIECELYERNIRKRDEVTYGN